MVTRSGQTYARDALTYYCRDLQYPDTQGRARSDIHTFNEITETVLQRPYIVLRHHRPDIYLTFRQPGLSQPIQHRFADSTRLGPFREIS
jgi:hypothetical protein